MPILHVLQGPDKGRTYETPNEPVVVGRSSDQIALSDDSASRRHAEIRPVNGSWVLIDLHSSNGTYVNGQRVVSPTKLKHGDQIRVGSTLLVFGGLEASEGSDSPIARDLIDIDLSANGIGASILTSVNTSQDSVILQPPETADAVAAWNVICKIAEIIGKTESVSVLLEKVADVITDNLIVDRLLILMPGPEPVKLTPQVVRYRKQEPGKRPQILASRTIINHVLKTREGVLCANAMTDDRFKIDSSQDSIHRLALRSVICVPIIAHESVQGILHIDCSMSYHTYTHEQLRLAVAIGRLTGMAMENARLLETRVNTERLAATGETVAYLSHHIRNILQGMQGGAEVVELGMKKKSLDIAHSGWTLVRRNLDRTLHLAMNMLTFSKERKPSIETAQLNRIVEDVISLAQGRADEAGIMILPELEDIPVIELDPDGIHQVAHNILINALEAVSPKTGRINVLTRYQPAREEVVLSICDNGPGIPENELTRIFDVFHSSKGHGGTGLGLAAARKIVGELGGRIEVESKVGEGTMFHVTLPFGRTRIADSSRTHVPGA